MTAHDDPRTLPVRYSAPGRMAATALALLLALAGPAPGLSAQDADAAPRPMTIVDLIEVPSLADARISPAGDRLLFVRRDADWEANGTVAHIWRVDADGDNLIQLTSGENGETSPRWSPDGSRIAFLARRGDDEHTQIHLLHTMGARPTPSPLIRRRSRASPGRRTAAASISSPRTSCRRRKRPSGLREMTSTPLRRTINSSTCGARTSTAGKRAGSRRGTTRLRDIRCRAMAPTSPSTGANRPSSKGWTGARYG